MTSFITRTLGGRALETLQERNFALFWLGQTVSVLGDRVYQVAFGPLVLALGGSSAELGRLFAVYSVVQLVFLLVGGVISDRIPKRRVLIVTDAVQGVTLGLTVLLMALGRLEVAHLYVLGAFFGLSSAFFLPASSSIVPEVVSRERLVPATALRAMSFEATGILGPVLGGVLIAAGGPMLAMGANAGSFLVSLGCLLLMRVGQARGASAVEHARPEHLNAWHEALEGLRVVRSIPWLWVTIALFALINIFEAGAVAILFPLIAAERLGGPSALGWLLSSLAAGALISALALARAGRLRRRGLLAYVGITVGGAGLLIVATSGLTPFVLPVALIGAALVGVARTVFGVIWTASLQELVPPESLARVSSVDMIGSFAVLPVGFVLVGSLASSLGAVTMLFVCGACVIALALLGVSTRAVRELD